MIYVSFLESDKHLHENRIVFSSSLGVIDYMAEVLSRIEKVDVLAPIRTNNKTGFIKGRQERYADNIVLKVPATFGCRTGLGRIFAIGWTQFWLLTNLLRYAKKGEPVIVYHSLSVMKAVTVAKAFKKFKLVSEIREIYADVHNRADVRKKEYQYFAKADAYIFATRVLNNMVNTMGKPYVIASGVYKPAPEMPKVLMDANKFHAVYAGTFTQAKGGALMAVRVAEFLPENFHVHILGKGSEEENTSVRNEIARVSASAQATITYDGFLRGDAFRSMLQSCDIGLSTQDIAGDFNTTSFPSKVLTYLSNGLPVVTGRIPAVETSDVDPYVVYYDSNSPKDIAQAVVNLQEQRIDAKAGLQKLDKELENALRNLLKKA